MIPVHQQPPVESRIDAKTIPIHSAVDRIIRRQQGRLIGQLRNKGKLDQETTSAVCRSYEWTGKDIHMAISGDYQESHNARKPQD